MRYRLDLVLKPVEGALVRVIGMTERRGFAPRAISGEGGLPGPERKSGMIRDCPSRPAAAPAA